MNPVQLTTADKAVEKIRDNSVLSFNGIGMIGLAEKFFDAIEKRYLKEGHPKNMTLYSACGLGSAKGEVNCLTHEGMFSCLVVGYIYPYAKFLPAISENKIEAYNMPQGIISTNYREAAAKRPGFYSRVGLHTFSDPRYQGGALNEISKREMASVHNIDGKEYLFYKTVFPDVCVLRGTTADPSGNITMEKEVNIGDALSLAMAVHNNHGLVMVQVEKLVDEPANPHDVIIPGAIVDDIWVSPNQVQTNLMKYNPFYSGQKRATRESIENLCLENISRGKSPGKPVSTAEKIIARRAALELKDSYMVNLGIGMPMLAGNIAQSMGLITQAHHLSIETGVMGGIPVSDAFGAVINADAIYSMAEQFDLYEGEGLDATFVGALEIDRHGNVNVIRKGDSLIGVGGFQHVTTAAKKVVVCSKFRVGSGYGLDQGKPTIIDGKANKFVEEVECIALNAPLFRSMGKEIMYITERAVFRLDDDGLVLTEIAPGLHPYFSVLAHIPFAVKVHPRLKNMPSICFDLSDIEHAQNKGGK